VLAPVADAAQHCARYAQLIAWPGVAALRCDRAWLAHNGDGASIGLIDCAIDQSCPDLVEADMVLRDFVGVADVSPANAAHGTAMARFMVGQGRHRLRGVIPRARLFAARVVGPGDTARTAAVAAAIDWLRCEGVTVIAMPIGSGRAALVIDAAIAAGGAAGMCFYAAGGSGTGDILYPARHPQVIAVGPCDHAGQLSPDARRLPQLDLLAPGFDIAATHGERRANGSSIATVLAAGAAMLGVQFTQSQRRSHEKGPRNCLRSPNFWSCDPP
jgi:Subtilase family